MAILALLAKGSFSSDVYTGLVLKPTDAWWPFPAGTLLLTVHNTHMGAHFHYGGIDTSLDLQSMYIDTPRKKFRSLHFFPIYRDYCTIEINT